MNLNISEWKPFIIEKLFTVKYGVNLELSNCDEIINNEEIGIKFVSRTESNNGVSATVMPIENSTKSRIDISCRWWKRTVNFYTA